jgi:hypothetical protein
MFEWFTVTILLFNLLGTKVDDNWKPINSKNIAGHQTRTHHYFQQAINQMIPNCIWTEKVMIIVAVVLQVVALGLGVYHENNGLLC